MPCNTYQGNNEELHLRYEGQHEELAKMLCSICKMIGEGQMVGRHLLPENVKEWYQKHKEWDEKS